MGSKGLPFKNRKLFEYTAKTIKEVHRDVIVSSDDEEIEKLSKEHGFNFHKRSPNNSRDESSLKDVMEEVISDYKIDKNDIVVVLLLTSPGRNFKDIQKGLNFFKKHKCKSMLCRTPAKVSPYLLFYKNDLHGEQVINHDLCRRQDYKECFQVSHFLCIFKVSELIRLNKNLLTQDTFFMDLDPDSLVDIDTCEDMKYFLNKKER